VLSVVNTDGLTESGSLVDEIVREGARRMPAAALEAEVNQYIAELTAETDERSPAESDLLQNSGQEPCRFLRQINLP
jgi:hypothetical protein